MPEPFPTVEAVDALNKKAQKDLKIPGQNPAPAFKFTSAPETHE
jgi:hypothetical protein